MMTVHPLDPKVKTMTPWREAVEQGGQPKNKKTPHKKSH